MIGLVIAAGALHWGAEPATPVVLFSVQVDQKGAYSLMPFIELRNGRPFEPGVVESDTGCHTFATHWMAAGRAYTVLFGGERVGRAVLGRDSAATVKLNRVIGLESPSAKEPGSMALAANSPALGRQSGTRRRPDPAERAAALDLVKAEFRRRAVPAALLSRLELVQLTSSDLNGDGRQDLLGVARIEPADQTGPTRTVFFVAEGDGSGYKATFVRYHSGRGETYELEMLIDHVDLDGDGLDEILTRASGWEWFTNRVYSRRSGRWVRIYEGHGCEGA